MRPFEIKLVIFSIVSLFLIGLMGSGGVESNVPKSVIPFFIFLLNGIKYLSSIHPIVTGIIAIPVVVLFGIVTKNVLTLVS